MGLLSSVRRDRKELGKAPDMCNEAVKTDLTDQSAFRSSHQSPNLQARSKGRWLMTGNSCRGHRSQQQQRLAETRSIQDEEKTDLRPYQSSFYAIIKKSDTPRGRGA